ncbi:unnamed protein product [Caenorhabditis angaria]|uniref:Uncharacterized protein n=1 Tax=Caenorhabditis angaria TaxID=860376 RepID=A0A9P1J3E5_9PELO|nr:unnamed protein product [Caenorhabditis angaria]
MLWVEHHIIMNKRKKQVLILSPKKHPKIIIDEPKICHGWLVVCEGNPTKMMNQEVKLPWHAGYCVYDPQHRTVCCYKHEPYHFNNMINRNASVRMDGGRAAFMNHWS